MFYFLKVAFAQNLVLCITKCSSHSFHKALRQIPSSLQPLDLNIDEDTLMRIVPFWRSSLNNSTSSSQYYFDHFEVHPIKV